MELQAKQKKDGTPYKVRTISDNTIKDVDINKRVVTGLFNSYYFIDSDMDMLLPGAAKKSILERGVNSTKGNRIKHLKDHDWSKNIARIDVLDERELEINGRKINGIYHESYYPKSTDSNDMLIKIQEGLYDARSIGFQYTNLALAHRDSDNEDQRKNFTDYLPFAKNPEVAEEAGYFWVVKEIILWEGSDVAFGANSLTPLLGIKSESSKTEQLTQLYQKLDACQSLMKTGKLSDDGFHQLEMEFKQIKSYIAEMLSQTPVKTHTPRRGRAEEKRQTDHEKFINQLIKLQK